MDSEKFGEDLKKLYPVVEADLSDSGSMDCCVEFLMQAGGRTLPEAVMTVVPEAWQNDTAMAEDKKSFYRFAACTMEPWDGPALVTFRCLQNIKYFPSKPRTLCNINFIQ